ncbi:MAG TPA: 3-dehydroquinate synthase [Syntrophales bacterium]|nr:3-dehydroquinate synthase [Syntrophales bacterium]
MKKIKVNLDKKISASYEICIGYDILDRIGLIIAKNLPALHYIVITDSHVSSLHGGPLLERLRGMKLPADMIEFPAGEDSKNIGSALTIVEKLLRLGADRKSALLALGGGVVGDMTGFIASTFMRSVPYIQIPTTLMAQVDSSIGGKTAIDLPEGKNLLGTFYQPKSVFIDVKFLDTIPDVEFNNGLVEVIKYGIIDDTVFFHFLEENMTAIKKRDRSVLEKIVENSCRIKKGIVEIDERENGLRRVLNFGHTIGHAIEAESGYTISHGAAVSLGIVAAVRISEKLYDLPREDRERIEHLLGKTGLPCLIPRTITADGILSRLKSDKKKEGDVIRFVLLKKMGMPFVNGGVPEAILRETMEDLTK